jgi:phosphoserine aminotransferase
MSRVHNFVAGPAVLPLPVLEKARQELLEFAGAGASVMELSHRSKEFSTVRETAEENIRRLMDISNDYAVLFLHGGASSQFALIPSNLRPEGQTADYIHTGQWSAKAIKEAQLSGSVNIAWDGKSDQYMRVPSQDELKLSDDAAYLHICSNETIGGICYPVFPESGATLVADMSSEIMSRVIDVNRFGMIYAGAQKNIGPSGLALVIIHKSLLDRCPESVQIFHRYRTHVEESSLYNTPNTWGIYIVKLVTAWLLDHGGVTAIEKINRHKALLLYEVLDACDFWKTPAHRDHRSIMNVVWWLENEELESKFIHEAETEGLTGLKGHRSIGGLRASIYNACALKSVEALVAFMRDFESRNG